MHKSLPSKDQPSPPFSDRLNRVCGEMNAFLTVLALGLAALDFVCFVMLRLVDTLAQLPLNAG